MISLVFLPPKGAIRTSARLSGRPRSPHNDASYASQPRPAQPQVPQGFDIGTLHTDPEIGAIPCHPHYSTPGDNVALQQLRVGHQPPIGDFHSGVNNLHDIGQPCHFPHKRNGPRKDRNHRLVRPSRDGDSSVTGAPRTCGRNKVLNDRTCDGWKWTHDSGRPDEEKCCDKR